MASADELGRALDDGLGTGNPATAEHAIAFVTDRGLAGSDGALRFIEDDAGRAIRARMNGRRGAGMPVANFDGGTKRLVGRAVPRGVVDLELLDDKILGIADNDAARGGIDV